MIIAENFCNAKLIERFAKTCHTVKIATKLLENDNHKESLFVVIQDYFSLCPLNSIIYSDK